MHPCCYLMPSFNTLQGFSFSAPEVSWRQKALAVPNRETAGRIDAVRSKTFQMPTLTAAISRSPQGKRVARSGSGSTGLQSLCIFCMIEPRRVSSLLSPQSQSIPTAPADSKLQLSGNTQRASSCTCCFLDTVLLSSSAYKGLNNKTLYFFSC